MMENYPKVIHKCSISGAETNLVCLRADRGVSRTLAMEKLAAWKVQRQEHLDGGTALGNGGRRAMVEYSGFWVAKKSHYGRAADGTAKPQVLMALEIASRYRRSTRSFKLFRPNNGDAGLKSLEDLQMAYTLHTDDSREAMQLWDFWYNKTDVPTGESVGIIVSRNISMFLLTGAILPVWKHILETYRQLAAQRNAQRGSVRRNKMTVVRTEISGTGERVVGLFPEGLDENMVDMLAECVRDVAMDMEVLDPKEKEVGVLDAK